MVQTRLFSQKEHLFQRYRKKLPGRLSKLDTLSFRRMNTASPPQSLNKSEEVLPTSFLLGSNDAVLKKGSSRYAKKGVMH
jgi:hypothetical protein